MVSAVDDDKGRDREMVGRGGNPANLGYVAKLGILDAGQSEVGCGCVILATVKRMWR
jgi:hypothetical protein